MTGLAADPARDAAFRERAKSIAAYIMDAIEEALSQPGMMNRIAREGNAQADISLGWKPEVVNEAIALGLEPRIEFGLFLAAYTSPIAAFSVHRQTGARYIVLNLLPEDAQEAASYALGRNILRRYMAKQLQDHRTVILHEIIHMFDNMRSQVKIREPSYARATGTAARILYFNNPEEFNAFFQQVVTEAVDELNAMPSRSRTATLRTFDRFLKHVNRQAIVWDLRRSFLPKFEKKFDARLWQTWEYLKKQQAGKEKLV